ncbi:Type IV pilus biogenesis protein PilF [Marinobacterium lacunae]|uniref:Type IV pilus biogenesis protein PilF n=1 Tax=Marinobacterium lacunae TaxID=1232683 RepID=A0A081G266_9GAMM|nr:type IV pilus biogenesis/stability protein PilW [Marinobacterium lacunae]KEA64871.1 Type IV pilus biogenesis protein PilF [Marinobacterium lacunae]MBR9884291.1 type IV pilus biogenesis/stability protein PilW [Oceanospirillales bacterium]
MRKLHAVLLIWAALGVSACTTTSDRFNSPDSSPQAALESYTSLGLQYLRAGNTASAKGPLQRALEIDADYAPAFNALALVFQAEEDLALSESYFRKAVAADPQSAMIHNNFGAFLFSQQRYEEACQELTRATEDPFYQARAQAFENMGRCYRKIGRLDIAEHAFNRALTLSRQRPIAMIELADILLAKGDKAGAAVLFDQFREYVDAKQIDHFALSLWVGVRVARFEKNSGRAATYALLLKNMFPESAEYQLYKESAQ